MTQNLGRLEQLKDLRSVWKSEPKDFTPWLQENIDLLAEALNLDIQLPEREAPVGSFAVDLLGEETSSKRPVVIENQLERSDHSHLGQLLTYSAGKNGGVIIWVAREISLEHRKALEWLNAATQGSIDFYGVEIQLMKIGESPMAPYFNVVVSPISPDFERPTTGEHSEREIQHKRFFTELIQRIKKERPGITNRSKIGYDSWISTPSGKGGFSFNLAFTWDKRFRIELYIDSGNRQANKHAFDDLALSRGPIEEDLGATLDWQRLDDRKGSRISWFWEQRVTILDPDKKLEDLSQWALKNYFKFREAMSHPLENLTPFNEQTRVVIDEGLGN